MDEQLALFDVSPTKTQVQINEKKKRNLRKSGVLEGWCIVRLHSKDDKVRVHIHDTRHEARFLHGRTMAYRGWPTAIDRSRGRYEEVLL